MSPGSKGCGDYAEEEAGAAGEGRGRWKVIGVGMWGSGVARTGSCGRQKGRGRNRAKAEARGEVKGAFWSTHAAEAAWLAGFHTLYHGRAAGGL
jgi:hypothetical protein